jgi:hypothetical protein
MGASFECSHPNVPNRANDSGVVVYDPKLSFNTVAAKKGEARYNPSEESQKP